VDAAIFDIAAERLESHSGFDRLEARGTLRIALKIAGLAANSVTVDQLCVVFEKLMPGELENRGVRDAAAVCSAVVHDLANTPIPAEAESGDDLDAIFRRLANG
jgi:hypothetical protein